MSSRSDARGISLQWHTRLLLILGCCAAMPCVARSTASAAVIVPGDVQDYIRMLPLPVNGNERFQQFDAFSWQREGLRVTAGPGSLFAVARDGRVERFTLAASGLDWAYTHPLEKDRRLYELLRTKHEDDVSFTPDFLDVDCDPATCAQILASGFASLHEITVDKAYAPLLRLHRSAQDETESRRREEDEPGLGAPYEDDHRYVAATVWQAGHSRMVQLEEDSHGAREVTVTIAGWGRWFHHSAATRAAGLPPEQLEQRPDAARRDYDLESLSGTVSMATGESELLSGNVTAGLRLKRDLRRVLFTLDGMGEHRGVFRRSRGPRLSVHSVQDGAGRNLIFTRTGPVSGVIELPEPARSGSLVTLHVRYDSRDAIKKVGGTYSYVDRDGWLPFVNIGDKISQFELRITAPDRYQVLCVGRGGPQSTRGEVSSSRCAPESPVVFPTAIFGIYKEYPSSVKATRKDGTGVPVTVFIDRETVAVMPSMRGAPAAADQAANALNLYRDIFGVDYPFDRLDVVNAPQGFSGQAPDGIVYLGDPTFLSEGRLGSALGGDVTRFKSGLVPHEVAHQWWGSLISNANDRSYWFVESLAEYSSALFLEASRGTEGYLAQVRDWGLEAVRSEGWWSVEDNEGIYTKGPYLFHIMRSTWGDERFFRFLKTLGEELSGREITTRDIERAAESAFGQRMGWFFDQWVRGSGIPEFTFTHRVTRSPDGNWAVEGEIDQRVMVTTKWPEREVLPDVYFQGAGIVTVVGKSGKEYTRKLALSGARTLLKQTFPEQPKEVLFNKYGEMLAYAVNKKGR